MSETPADKFLFMRKFLIPEYGYVGFQSKLTNRYITYTDQDCSVSLASGNQNHLKNHYFVVKCKPDSNMYRCFCFQNWPLNIPGWWQVLRDTGNDITERALFTWYVQLYVQLVQKVVLHGAFVCIATEGNCGLPKPKGERKFLCWKLSVWKTIYFSTLIKIFLCTK